MSKNQISSSETERRSVIVMLLAKTGISTSDRVLVSVLNHLGIATDLGTVRTDLSALEGEGLVSVENIGGEYAFHNATITRTGRRAAKTVETAIKHEAN